MEIEKASEYMGDLRVALNALDNSLGTLNSKDIHSWDRELQKLRSKAETIALGYKASAATGKNQNDVELLRGEAGFWDEFHGLVQQMTDSADVNKFYEKHPDAENYEREILKAINQRKIAPTADVTETFRRAYEFARLQNPNKSKAPKKGKSIEADLESTYDRVQSESKKKKPYVGDS